MPKAYVGNLAPDVDEDVVRQGEATMSAQRDSVCRADPAELRGMPLDLVSLSCDRAPQGQDEGPLPAPSTEHALTLRAWHPSESGQLCKPRHAAERALHWSLLCSFREVPPSGCGR
jgi:hypothetical protein